MGVGRSTLASKVAARRGKGSNGDYSQDQRIRERNFCPERFVKALMAVR